MHSDSYYENQGKSRANNEVIFYFIFLTSLAQTYCGLFSLCEAIIYGHGMLRFSYSVCSIPQYILFSWLKVQGNSIPASWKLRQLQEL
jgi:hypothetical protein